MIPLDPRRASLASLRAARLAFAFAFVGLAACASNAERRRPPLGVPAAGAPMRVAVQASPDGVLKLTPLLYGGGFQSKSMVYETLVTRDAQGRLAPGLAERWDVSDDGLTVRLVLRANAIDHEGESLTAAASELHFRRWVGLPEHGWLGATHRIRSVVAEDTRTLRIELDQPYALLDDLCAINPCAVQAPSALDREGAFVRPVGTGPFRYVEELRPDVQRFAATEDRGRVGMIDVVAFDDEGTGATDALLRGEVDLVVDGWYEQIPRERVDALRARDDLVLFDGPGSSVQYVSFSLAGPTADREVRRAVASAVDRAALVRDVERGHADPTTSFFAPTLSAWPTGSGTTAPAGPVSLQRPLRVLVDADSVRALALGGALVRQLQQVGIRATLERAVGEALAERIEAGAFDLRLERTWGVPYDPLLSLRDRFLPPPDAPSASQASGIGADPRIADLVAEASRIAIEADRATLYTRLQQLFDEEALVISLYTPRRLGVARIGRARPLRLDHDIYRTRFESQVPNQVHRRTPTAAGATVEPSSAPSGVRR